jgi:hypothetical protein
MFRILRESLRQGDKRSVAGVEMVVRSVKANPELFASLLKCFDTDDEALNMRVADAMQKILVANPRIAYPYVEELFDLFVLMDQKEIRWHMAQIIPKLKLNRNQTANAVEIWSHDIIFSKSMIVKTFSLQAIYDIADKDEKYRALFIKLANRALKSDLPALKARARVLKTQHKWSM